MLLNVNAPRIRGSVFGVYNLVDDLGKGLGPAFAAALISVPALGRVGAFNVSLMSWLLTGACLILTGCTVVSDESKVARVTAAAAAAAAAVEEVRARARAR